MKGIVDADTKSERQGMSITILSLQSFIHTQDKKIKNQILCVIVLLCLYVYVCVRETKRDLYAMLWAINFIIALDIFHVTCFLNAPK